MIKRERKRQDDRLLLTWKTKNINEIDKSSQPMHLFKQIFNIKLFEKSYKWITNRSTLKQSLVRGHFRSTEIFVRTFILG